MNDDEKNEERWIRGNRAAYVAMLQHCIGELGHGPELDAARLILEREQAIAALRLVCDEHGDNDWEPSLHLADIIDKHLGKHL